jgi:hypothetical protein
MSPRNPPVPEPDPLAGAFRDYLAREREQARAAWQAQHDELMGAIQAPQEVAVEQIQWKPLVRKPRTAKQKRSLATLVADRVKRGLDDR